MSSSYNKKRKTFSSKYLPLQTKKAKNNAYAKETNKAASFLLLKTPGQVVPDRIMVNLSYSETVELVNALSSTAAYDFRGNSCFDPNFTGTGHQPMGFDQLAALYSTYRVISSRCDVSWFQAQSTTNGVDVCLYPSDQTGSVTFDEALEQPYAIKGMTSGTSGMSRCRTSSFMTTKKLNGQKDIMTQSQYAALTSANPSDVWYWRLQAQNANQAINCDVFAQVKITYFVEFSDRLKLSSS